MSIQNELSNIDIAKLNIVHYCCSKFPDNFGGVARFDYHISIVFPHRKYFTRSTKKAMQEYLANSDKNNVLVITDNHYACDIPNDYKVILVHHGCAKVTIERAGFQNDNFYKTILRGQDNMFKKRDPRKTLVVSCSYDCVDSFAANYPIYSNFAKKILWHSSELDYIPRIKNNKKPIILGNWAGNKKKGSKEIHAIKEELKDEFEFIGLHTKNNKDIQKHNKEIEQIYGKADIFLQLSVAEGNSYATLDGFSQNLLVCGSNVGLLYDLEKLGEDVSVIFDWQKNGDAKYVANKIRYLWNNRDKYNGLSRNWYEENCPFEDWKLKMTNIVKEFAQA